MVLAAPSARGALGMSVTSGGTWQAGPETRSKLVLLAPAGLLLALAVRGDDLRGGGKPAGMARPRIPEPACGAAQPHTLRAMTGVFMGWSGPLGSDNVARTVTAAWERLPRHVNGRVKAFVA